MNRKIWKGILLGALVAGLALASTWSTAGAGQPPKIECQARGGTWTGATDWEKGGKCELGKIVTSACPSGFGIYTATYTGGDASIFSPPNWVFGVDCTDASYGMERKGYCKLMDIADASLGGTITATIKGAPSTLKLKADGKTYSLPVVPGSVVANGNGAYTAQFYTIDPETGQALVPAGDYTARCHGANGSKDGGSANTVSIGY